MARTRYRAALVILVAAALVSFAGLVLWLGVPPYIAWLGGWSGATFAAYAIDKSQARRGGWRIPEIALHGLAIVGGAIGGWVGMLGLRHKTRHPVFPLVLAISVTVQVVVGVRLVT
jgi:uncharacterized membrane protein YsdA (DUF1294 family)